MNKKVELTATDIVSIREGEIAYLTTKGANLYNKNIYYKAVEYYRLAAAMGEMQAVSNLGYCYLYGRDIEANTSLAIGYFTIAANQGVVDAAYKLGDIYGSNKWGVKDKELSIYYYNRAAILLLGSDLENNDTIARHKELQEYPSLCYALAKEMFPGGSMPTDIRLSYQFLKYAEKGYKLALANGNLMYEDSYNGVVDLLNEVLDLLGKNEYNVVRQEIDDSFDEQD